MSLTLFRRLMADACIARAASDALQAAAFRVCAYLEPAERLQRELQYLDSAARERAAAAEWYRVRDESEAQE